MPCAPPTLPGRCLRLRHCLDMTSRHGPANQRWQVLHCPAEMPGLDCADQQASAQWVVQSVACDTESHVLYQLQAKQTFASVWGCGDIVAAKWYHEGCRTLDDVRKRTDLTMQQQVPIVPTLLL